MERDELHLSQDFPGKQRALYFSSHENEISLGILIHLFEADADLKKFLQSPALGRQRQGVSSQARSSSDSDL